jgi:fibronectin type 3 domain-containing protein
VSYDTATGKAKITWAKNKEMDLAGYRVYRRLKGTVFPAKPLATTTSTTYTDTPPATGATYYYELRAYDKAGNESAGTADQAVTTADRTAPAAPTGLRTSVGAGSVRLAWEPADGAATYRAYRATAPEGPFTRIADALGDPSYRDTSADIHRRLYYRVTAVDAAGNESAPSATADTGEPDTTPPAQVTGLTAEGTTAGNAVRWQASSADVEHYEVWAAPDGQSDPDGPATVFGTSYNDLDASAGVPVTYRVQAVDAYGNVSPVSEPVTATRPTVGQSPAPTGVTGTPRDSETALTWEHATDGAQYGYRVYRRATSSEAWTRLGDSATTANRYSDTQAQAGTADYYVVTLDAQGDESAPSAVVTVTRTTPATPTAALAPVITLSAPYTECTANDCAGHGGIGQPVTVTLSRPAGDDRIIGGYRWHVYGGSDNSAYTTTPDSRFTWTPGSIGTHVVEVATVDVYGRVGPDAELTFKVG